ncbi:hypothetical protein BGX21_006854 [Mortierella sp. AD011]|nr:hypothetical protein BGX20_001542 [Mortierella sp. AD010]KAF9399063.1 hypothetical protein BGX21_006854 [Mortierella sp. AD011]
MMTSNLHLTSNGPQPEPPTSFQHLGSHPPLSSEAAIAMAERFLQERASRLSSPTIQEDGDGDESGQSYPPPNYAADKVWNFLQPIGPSLFGHKDSANCILRAGPLKFFVHVPVLASRSPTFRGIFNEMIDKDAWGSRGDGSSDGSCEDSDMETDDVLHEGPSDQEMQESKDPNEDDDCDDDDDDDVDDVDDVDDEDEDMPVLNVDLVDPVGSHFEELLRWIYTNDGERWMQCFTPTNYCNILQNICYLNIRTQEVLEICQRFEDSLIPEYDLRGMAVEVMERFVEAQQLLRQEQQQQQQQEHMELELELEKGQLQTEQQEQGQQ